MRIRIFAILPFATALLGATPVRSAPIPVTGVFTDMRYNEDGGDVLGMEVFIVGARGGWYATVQCAGGEAAKPVVVPVRVHEAQVAFSLPAGLPECGVEFTGRITRQGLRGRFRDEATDRWLPRKASYWQR